MELYYKLYGSILSEDTFNQKYLTKCNAKYLSKPIVDGLDTRVKRHQVICIKR
jgi:hypothetical protein